MKIQPLGNQIQIKTDEAQAGVLDTSSLQTAVEYGEVVAVGEEVKLKIKKGDKVFFKAWAVDTINHKDKVYRFICPESNGLLAIFNDK